MLRRGGEDLRRGLSIHYPPMPGAPLSWLVPDSSSSVQVSLGDEMGDTVTEIIVDADAIQLILGNELVNPSAGNAEHFGG